MLPFSKRVIIYLSKSKSEALISELMNEIDSVMSFNNLIEKTEAPQFYRYKTAANINSINTSVTTTSNNLNNVTTVPIIGPNLNTSVIYNDENETSTH